VISFLRGLLHYKKAPFLIVEVNGVGYGCQAPLSTFYKLPEIGEKIFLYTHFAVREDAHALYAFFQEQECKLFKSLIKVNNVGPKLALAILSNIEVDLFVQCILEQNIDSLIHIPGVGKKTAERLVIEMKDRLHDWGSRSQEESTSTKSTKDCMVSDAISVLQALGYKSQEATKLITNVTAEYLCSEELIRLALKSTLKVGKND
jgi:holliday junction DNA helicase RuvA